MNCRMLQENLRTALWRRINAGELSGSRLDEEAGFEQAHISNFLNRKRGLSLEGMDKILELQHLSVLDLIDPAEMGRRLPIVLPVDDQFENVVVTEPEIAATQARIVGVHVKEILKFKKSFLRRLREAIEGDREGWERFVVLKVDAREGMSMYPRMLPGATLLIDRHYNSLAPYRKGEHNMYAVRKDQGCTIKYVELAGNHLVLRPHNAAYPVEVLTMEHGMKPGDYIVGRVCYVGIET